MANDVRTVIKMENFVALELPLPSSFVTWTLQKKKGQYVSNNSISL